MKRLYATFFAIAFFATAGAQTTYRNEWILTTVTNPYSLQQYLKISVSKDGIHRVTYADVSQFGGFTLEDPNRFQLFHNGVEQYIYVAGEADSSFDPGDFIEFYGEKNRGEFDTHLYDSAWYQINPYYSLFNDTAAYFLTFNYDAGAKNKRMIGEAANNFGAYTPATHFLHEVVTFYTGEYGTGYSQPSVDSRYTDGEGHTGARFSGAQTRPLATPNILVQPGLDAEVSTIFMRLNAQSGSWKVYCNGLLLGLTIPNFGYSSSRFQTSIPTTSFSGPSADFTYDPFAASGTQSNSIPFVRAKYPHRTSLKGEADGNYKITLVASTTSARTLLNVDSFQVGNPSAKWVYVFSGADAGDTVRRVTAFSNGTLMQALPTTNGNNRIAVLSTDNTVITTQNAGFAIAPVTTAPTHYARFNNFEYQNLYGSDYLLISHPRLWGAAMEYRDYRASAPGGGFNVLMADVTELYDQFAFGIDQDPDAIRNFCQLTVDKYNAPPTYLFLFGKSYRPEDVRLNPAYYERNLVPTYGHPPSDMILSAKRQGDTLYIPQIATGRLAARDSAGAALYLDKIKAHDMQHLLPPQEWMKKVLHFGGGGNAYEQGEIKKALNEYKMIIEDTLYAGSVTTFLKTSTDPIQVNTSAYLQNLIDSGTTIMTFFAHASGSTFDIQTDDPSKYNNKDKYPVIIANSCFIGDIHVDAEQSSEKFIFQKDKGAIGFIASPHVGYIQDQEAYTKPLYRQIASLSYGQGIGLCMKHSIDNFYYLSPGGTEALTLGMTLHGDPALRLYDHDKPDLVAVQAVFSPASISSDMPSFDISVVIKNLGRAINKPYQVRITRRFPDGFTPWVYETTLSQMPFVDTLVVTVPMNYLHAPGLNLFDIIVDATIPDEIDESNEFNNTLMNVPLLIRSGDIVPVFPAKYAIVPDPTLTLKASTTDLFAPATDYLFEIDTTDRFSMVSSGAYQSVTVNSKGGIVSWDVPFQLLPNRVYYWRVANKKIQTDTSYKWNESSFIHIPGKTGWSQAHYSQFKEDLVQNIIYTNQPPAVDTTFTFVSVARPFKCNNSLKPNYVLGNLCEYLLDNQLQEYGGCPNQINLAVLDSITLTPWTNADHDLGNWNKYNPVTHQTVGCNGPGRERPEAMFCFKTLDPAHQDSLVWALADSIPDGNYILMYTYANPHYGQWKNSLRSAFEALGSQLVTLNDTPAYWQPMIFFAKKGVPSSALEVVGDSLNPDISIDTLLGGNWDKGFVTSVRIGPATQWSELHWDQYPVEAASQSDSIHLSIIGIDTALQETVVWPVILKDSLDMSIASIDAAKYPYLKLRAYMQDEVLKSPPQLLRWQIYYTEVPEGSLNPIRHFAQSADTLDEGGQYTFEMAFENISTTAFPDSVAVDFYVYDGNNNRIDVGTPRYQAIAPGEYFIAKTAFDTRGHAGVNSMWIEANPFKSTHLQEQYHFNNIASSPFTVNRDITNPVLDVTFDGVHILNGDIVSPRPLILMRLKDENKYIALADTARYRVFLTDSTGAKRQVYFETNPNTAGGTDKMKWTPASLPDNTFVIEYNPNFTADGIYTLEVQGSDEAGNLSGSNDFSISFEVINRSTITEVINYPNPFSTSTRFVFTLTGSEIPTGMRIQIMTVSGKIVRTILQDEIGPIHIGRNITQYAWDGKDDFGDQLANGVYLYRVNSRINGQGIEHRETAADRYFKKGWGKMYLMR